MLATLTIGVTVGGIALATVALPTRTGAFVLVAMPALLLAAAIRLLHVAEVRRLSAAIIALGSTSFATAFLDAALTRESRPIGLGLLALLPGAVTLLVPLPPRRHDAWFGAAAVAAAFLAVLDARLVAGELAVGLLPFVLACAISSIANHVAHRERARTLRRLVSARRQCAEMKAQRADLRRQDDFLMVQQETLVAQQAELLRLNEELASVARIDALTGLGNRLRLNEDLAQLAGQLGRSGGSAGILLLDLDRFKRLNDVDGHLAGDAALRGVADALRTTCRVGDGLYRYGGEEFLVVLRDADASVLGPVGRRYLAAIRDAALPHPDNDGSPVVTASAGGSELSPRTGLDLDAALRAADDALYRAKAAGRDRVEVATPPVVSLGQTDGSATHEEQNVGLLTVMPA